MFDFIPTADVTSATFDLTSEDPDLTFTAINDTTKGEPDLETVTAADLEDKTESTEDSVAGVIETTTAVYGLTDIDEDDSKIVKEPSTVTLLEDGDCIRDQIVYSNGTAVPASTPCQEVCRCQEGVINCELQACPPSPPAFLKCAPIKQADQCCPSYDCRE